MSNRSMAQIIQDAHRTGNTVLSNAEAGKVISYMAGTTSTKMHNTRPHGKSAPHATFMNKRFGLQVVCFGVNSWVALAV